MLHKNQIPPPNSKFIKTTDCSNLLSPCTNVRTTSLFIRGCILLVVFKITTLLGTIKSLHTFSATVCSPSTALSNIQIFNHFKGSTPSMKYYTISGIITKGNAHCRAGKQLLCFGGRLTWYISHCLHFRRNKINYIA